MGFTSTAFSRLLVLGIMNATDKLPSPSMLGNMNVSPFYAILSGPINIDLPYPRSASCIGSLVQLVIPMLGHRNENENEDKSSCISR